MLMYLLGKDVNSSSKTIKMSVDVLFPLLQIAGPRGEFHIVSATLRHPHPARRPPTSPSNTRRLDRVVAITRAGLLHNITVLVQPPSERLLLNNVGKPPIESRISVVGRNQFSLQAEVRVDGNEKGKKKPKNRGQQSIQQA